jgi:hypothetical protein
MKKQSGNSDRALKDLTPREKHDVRGGTFSSTMSAVKQAWTATVPDKGDMALAKVLASAGAIGTVPGI